MPASKVAFVAGANGITGSYIIEHILSNETPFERIIATSRRPPNADWVEKDLPPNVLGGKLVWVTADLVTESVNELSAKFAEVGAADATHFYWGAYLLGDGWGSKSELELNRTMFDNCLRAVLKATNGKLERVLLQLGEKVRRRTRAAIASKD